MIINTQIKKTLNEISAQTVKYMNSPDKERKYLLRLFKIFKTTLTEEEQIFVFKIILEQIHFRNIISDPDNIIQIHNVKLKTITYVFLLTVVLVVLVAILFTTNESLAGIITMFSNIFRILAI